MAETFDIAIVGAGITGCAIARQLARFDLSICVVEAANDVALGASKANGGLVHTGYDPAPGTVKAQVNARGCELYGMWAQELGFLFRRTGSMVLGFNDEDRAHLEKLRQNGLANGVPELSIIGTERISELEPRASAEATCALWCPSTGFVDPFEVAIAALENAVANGVTFIRSAPVEAIEVAGGEATDGASRFTLVTPVGDVRCRYLINAAGNGAADISHMAGAEEFQMVWRQGNIVVLDKEPRALMPLYPVPTPVSKGVIVTGTVHGNTVITATAAVREPGDTQTYASDVNALLTGAHKLVPDLDTRRVVRAFAGGRPVIKGTNDFFIGQSAVVPGLFQAAGIQSPGVASAPAIAERMEHVMREAGVALREGPIGIRFDTRRTTSTVRRLHARRSSSSPTLHGGRSSAAARQCPRPKSWPRFDAARVRFRSRASSGAAVRAWAAARAAFARAAWLRSLPASWAATPARCCWRIPDPGWLRDR